MAYEYDIFISYRRSNTAGQWVRNHLKDRLEARINEEGPYDIRISFDEDIDNGSALLPEIKDRIRKSKLLVTIWSADYFRSRWCMAEWRSFKEREKQLNMACDENPDSLIYPVRYADGDYYHDDANVHLCKVDFGGLTYGIEAFRNSVAYLEFDNKVTTMAKELVKRLDHVPPWHSDFPVEEPEALPPADAWSPKL